MTGKQFYEDSLEVIRKYDKMHQNLFSTNQKLDGNITIGIPPLILSIVFQNHARNYSRKSQYPL